MAESADILRGAASEGHPAGPRRRLLDGRHGRARSARDVLARARRDGRPHRRRRGGEPVSSPSPTSTRPPAIKAFVGEHGGIVCTSTNAAAVMTWAWERGEKLLMLPDQHLGRNTAFKMGVPLDEMVVWDPERDRGAGSTPSRSKKREADPLEGPLLGPHALHRRADRRLPEAVSGRPGHRASRVHVRRRAGGRRSGSTEYIIKTVQGAVRRDRSGRSGPKCISSTACARGRARPHRRHARSVRLPLLDDVPRLAEPPAVDPRRAVDGQVHNQIVVPDETRSAGREARARIRGIASTSRTEPDVSHRHDSRRQ